MLLFSWPAKAEEPILCTQALRYLLFIINCSGAPSLQTKRMPLDWLAGMEVVSAQETLSELLLLLCRDCCVYLLWGVCALHFYSTPNKTHNSIWTRFLAVDVASHRSNLVAPPGISQLILFYQIHHISFHCALFRRRRLGILLWVQFMFLTYLSFVYSFVARWLSLYFIIFCTQSTGITIS